MAGNMDTSFGTELSNINQKIKEFPSMEVENALNNTVSALSQSIAKKRRFTQMQEKELTKLEKEVKYLEKEVITKEEILKSKRKSIAGEGPKYKSVEEIHKEIEKMEEKIEMMEKLTGFSFSSSESQILEEDQSCLQSKYKIQGECSGIQFNIEFEVEEKMEKSADDGDGDVSSVAEITQLTIYVPDEVFRELGPGLDRVVSDKSLQGFYRILGPYSQWSQHRQDTLDYFCRTYPDFTSVVEKDDVPYLLIQNPKNKNRPVFAVSWKYKVNDIYRAEPCIELGVQAPESLSSMDEEKVLKEAPENFQLMLKEIGIERTIDALIQLIKNVCLYC